MKTLLLFAVSIVIVNGVPPSDNWRWSWTCNKLLGKCERTRVENEVSDSPYDTLPACRVTCGTYGALWPRPTTVPELSAKLIPFHPSSINYNFANATNAKLEYLTAVKDIFEYNLITECGSKCTIDSETIVNVLIETSYDDLKLLPDTDESYSLEISTKDSIVGILILAPTVYGIRHGFETLSQLTAPYNLPSDGSSAANTGLVMVTAAKILDKPVFTHRGLLLDTGRNYLTVDAIKKQMDGMAASKLNVFHWHATDSQSFPLEIPSLPQMTQYGAYSRKHTYTKSDIQDLQAYARLRGIRIILEIDAPSHAGNGWQWGEAAGLGKLAVCVNQQPWRQFCIQPPCGQLNPANKQVYGVLRELYRDLQDVSNAGEYFHMGGDEVFLACWNSTNEIVSYMNQKGWGRTTEDFLKLWSEYQENALRIYDNVTKTPNNPIILWSSQLTEPENIEKYLSKDRYIVQTWVPASSELPEQLLQKGYRLIISTKDTWYLDHGFWGSTTYHNWRVAYKNRVPRTQGVLGGEACMWGELVDDTSVDSRVWPRTAAVAERLWSDPPTDESEVEPRFYRHRDRLVARGIDAEALAPGWCVQNEGHCR